jgi:hypothetical protein
MCEDEAARPSCTPPEDLPVDDRTVVQHCIARVDHLRLEGMFGAFHLVDVDSKPRSGGYLPESVDHADRPLHDIEIPGHGTHHLLLDDMVRRRHREMLLLWNDVMPPRNV